MLTPPKCCDYYLDRTGFAAREWAFYEVFGLFRLAVIAQQIYYRYTTARRAIPPFKHFWVMVNYLHWRCRPIMRNA